MLGFHRHSMSKLSSARASTLRKAMRVQNINDGKRPVWKTMPRKTLDDNTVLVLHPTKGWRKE